MLEVRFVDGAHYVQFRQRKKRKGEASQLVNIGLIYFDKGELDEALKYQKDALKIFEEIGMPALIEKVKNNIANIEKLINQ